MDTLNSLKMASVLTLLILSATSCQLFRPIIVDDPCPRDGYWEHGKEKALPKYDNAQRLAFVRNEDASFTDEARYVRTRWKALERYCFAMRNRQ